MWRLENKKSWWTWSSMTLFSSNATICVEHKRQKCIIMMMSRDMYYKDKFLERWFENVIKLNQIIERKTLEDMGGYWQRQLSRAIFTSACFWSLVLKWDASLMAVLILPRSAHELNFWAANLKGAEDFEGFCFHRKYECSAMIAVAGQ